MELLTLLWLMCCLNFFIIDFNNKVASPGIEPGLRASETLVLSIVLQGLIMFVVFGLLFIVQLILSISFSKICAFKHSTFSNAKQQTPNPKNFSISQNSEYWCRIFSPQWLIILHQKIYAPQLNHSGLILFLSILMISIPNKWRLNLSV